MDFQPVIKWIGSKRIQSEEIVSYFPDFISTYYEPFCGGCSVLFQLAKSERHCVNRYVCSDINGDLIDLWNTVKRDPDGLFREYERMWGEMRSLGNRQDMRRYFESVRDEFNQTRSPYSYFFLMRTCTNGIPRYNKYGEFNNSFHISRDGIKPKRLKPVLYDWSDLLNRNNVVFKRCDYRMMLDMVDFDDFAYLDPPYDVTRSTGRYFGSIDYGDMFDRLRIMAGRGMHFCLSFDRSAGTPDVPDDCYSNMINISARNWGYRKTVLKMDNGNVYESLYIN